MVNISVIIPTLNEEKCLDKTLYALKNQIQKGDEIIIVDSYSKDKTVKIAKRYGAKVFYIKRCGIGPAKTFGAKKAKNEIIAMLDADGIPAKDWMKRIKDHFRNPFVSAVAGFGLYPGPTKSRNFIYNGFSRFVFILGYAQYKTQKIPWIPVNNCAIRKKIFLKYGGLRQVVCEDFDFAIRAKGLKNVKYDPKLNVTLSDRRYKKSGFLKTILLWLWSDITIKLSQKKINALSYDEIR